MGFIKDHHERQVKNFLARHKGCAKDNHVCHETIYLSTPIIRRKPKRPTDKDAERKELSKTKAKDE